MRLPVKFVVTGTNYAFAIGLIFILNGVVGLLGFEAKRMANLMALG
ncbi:Putative inner membrane protein [Salmonella enterica subsp. arizonae]|uniref:Inner membrane protein n=1 Tax=Salmonella enterica subsp. arizonae TaxID=59203 RepID=A0A379SIY5_SALER|nr:Putative inner membrane protein [Salmonella enterica subsp. arizonae]